MKKKLYLKLPGYFPFLFLFAGLSMTSQIKVFSNGTEVKANKELKFSEIKTLTVKFSGAKKIPFNTVGKAIIYAKINDSEEACNFYYHNIEGFTAVENFLYKSNTEETIIIDDKSKTSMTASGCQTNDGYQNLRSVLNTYTLNAKYKKIKVEIGLYFKEKLTHNTYGEKVQLLNPITFYIEVWSGNIVLPGSDLKFNPLETGYKEMWNTGKEIKIILEKSWLSYKVFEVTADSSVYKIEQLKTSFENYLKYYANQFNGDKILKQFSNITESFWSKNSGPNGIHGFSQSVIRTDLDEKENQNYSQVKIWEKFSLGKIIGDKFQSLRYASGNGKFRDPDPKGLTILYMFVHPADPKKILLFSHVETDGKKFTEETLKQIIVETDKFLGSIENN